MKLAVQTNDPATLVGVLAVFALLAIGLFRFIKSFLSGPVRPDPWDGQISPEVFEEDHPRLCHRCLVPHDAQTNFCPECGAAVGDYTNVMPYLYIFSIGHTFRIGTEGTFKRSPLTVIGFFIASTVEYAVVAPIYWFFFLRKILAPPAAAPPAPDSTSHAP